MSIRIVSAALLLAAVFISPVQARSVGVMMDAPLPFGCTADQVEWTAGEPVCTPSKTKFKSEVSTLATAHKSETKLLGSAIYEHGVVGNILAMPEQAVHLDKNKSGNSTQTRIDADRPLGSAHLVKDKTGSDAFPSLAGETQLDELATTPYSKFKTKAKRASLLP